MGVQLYYASIRMHRLSTLYRSTNPYTFHANAGRVYFWQVTIAKLCVLCMNLFEC